MSTETGIFKPLKIVPIIDSEAHLQNEIITTEECYVCHEKATEEMALMRVGEKKMATVCLDHKGVMQEFLRQFKMIPLGWTKAQEV